MEAVDSLGQPALRGVSIGPNYGTLLRCDGKLITPQRAVIRVGIVSDGRNAPINFV